MRGSPGQPTVRRWYGSALACFALTLAVGVGCGDSHRADRLATEGLELARAGAYSEALSRFDEALELAPSNAKAAYNKGVVFLAIGSWERAADAFTAFVSVHPQDNLGWFEKARAEMLLQRPDESIRSLQRAVELGLSDYDLLISDGLFAGLYGDLRFVALEMTVAQRAGVEAKAGVLGQPPGMQPGAGPGNYRLPPMQLPGVGTPCALADGGVCSP